jgi:hypothetical protein
VGEGAGEVVIVEEREGGRREGSRWGRLVGMGSDYVA